MVQNSYFLPANAGDAGDMSLIPGLKRSPGGGNGNSFQYFCLKNPSGWRSLGNYSLWGGKESNTTEWLSTYTHFYVLGYPCDAFLLEIDESLWLWQTKCALSASRATHGHVSLVTLSLRSPIVFRAYNHFLHGFLEVCCPHLHDCHLV